MSYNAQGDPVSGMGVMGALRANRMALAGRSVSAGLQAYIKQAVRGRVEIKYYDLPVAITADGSSPPNGQNASMVQMANVSTGTVVALFAPAQGTQNKERIGDAVTLRKMSFFYRIVQSATAANLMDSTQRVILFQWKPVTTPTFSKPKASLYRIIYDRQHHTKKNCENGQQLVYLENESWMGAGDDHGRVQFQAASTTGTNKVYLLCMTDSSGTDRQYIDYYSRIDYYDA
jgi:hypothetical protein